MLVYAGIDEAGYGPRLGPMVVGRSVICIPNLDSESELPDLWRRLSRAVCRNLSERKGRIAINDSKKLTTKAAGIKHLELGCLSFAHLWGKPIETLENWLEEIGASTSTLPWYAPTEEHPWQTLPDAQTPGEVAIAANMLANTAERIGVEFAGFGVEVLCEDRFNELVGRTHNKASVSFTCVTRHINAIWKTYGEHAPIIVVDRQGGRTRYREPLQLSFPDAHVTVLEETNHCSSYHLEADGQSLSVRFMVSAEEQHMPVALASMASKYTRELLMGRFNTWWSQRIEGLRPTAGYTADARRWLDDVRDKLPSFGVEETTLCRLA